MKIAAWGSDEFEVHPGGPKVLGHEVDDAFFDLEGAGDAEEGGGRKKGDILLFARQRGRATEVARSEKGDILLFIVQIAVGVPWTAE